MFAHVLLAGALYTFLTIARAPAVWGIGRRKDGSNPFESIEAKISANLSNQFEWPILFYTICILLISSGKETIHVYLWLAWLFIAGRIIHSLVHIFTNNIRLRGVVFTINFLAVFMMWVVYLLQ
jgi:hypothetical protein